MTVSDTRTYNHNLTDERAKRIFKKEDLERYKRKYLRPNFGNQQIETIFKNETDELVHEMIGTELIEQNDGSNYLKFVLLKKQRKKEQKKASPKEIDLSEYTKHLLKGKKAETLLSWINKINSGQLEMPSVSQKDIFQINMRNVS